MCIINCFLIENVLFIAIFLNSKAFVWRSLKRVVHRMSFVIKQSADHCIPIDTLLHQEVICSKRFLVEQSRATVLWVDTCILHNDHLPAFSVPFNRIFVTAPLDYNRLSVCAWLIELLRRWCNNKVFVIFILCCHPWKRPSVAEIMVFNVGIGVSIHWWRMPWVCKSRSKSTHWEKLRIAIILFNWSVAPFHLIILWKLTFILEQ